MSTKNVIFSNPGDVIDFVKIVEKYPFDMDMKRGRYIVDAKSLLGLMNLGFDQKIELKVYDEECAPPSSNCNNRAPWATSWPATG